MFASSLVLRSVCVLSLCGSACIPTTRRVAAPLELPSGEPQNDCERKAFGRLAPALSSSRERERQETSKLAFAPRELTGLAVFDARDRALPVDSLWPRFAEPELARAHDARTAPIERRQRQALYWGLASLAFEVAGVGYGVSGGNHPNASQIAAMGTGLVLGVASAIVGWVRMPSRSDRITLDLRQHLFAYEEDDASAVTRGVVRMNQTARTRCLADARED